MPGARYQEDGGGVLQEHADGHATVILFLFLRDGNPVESMQIVDDSRVRGMYFQSRES